MQHGVHHGQRCEQVLTLSIAEVHDKPSARILTACLLIIDNDNSIILRLSKYSRTVLPIL